LITKNIKPTPAVAQPKIAVPNASPAAVMAALIAILPPIINPALKDAPIIGAAIYA